MSADTDFAARLRANFDKDAATDRLIAARRDGVVMDDGVTLLPSSTAPSGEAAGVVRIRQKEEDAFFPAVCQRLDRHVPVPTTLPARTPMVVAWPIVNAPQAKVNRYLDYLTTVQNRRWKLPNGIIAQWMSTPERFDHIALITVGFIPETENTARTRGTMWMAVAYTAPKTSSSVRRLIDILNRSAQEAAGIDRFREMPTPSAPSIAPGMGTQDLLQGAYRSARGTTQFAVAMAGALTASRVARPSKEIAAPIRSRAQQVATAFAVLQQVPQLPAQIGTIIAQAKQAEPAQGQQMLDGLLGVLRGAKAALLAGQVAAPLVVQDGTKVRSETLRDLRQTILSEAKAHIDRVAAFSIARDFVRCMTLSLAWRSLKGQIDRLLSDLHAGIHAAGTLIQQDSAVNAALRSLDQAIEKVEFEKSQLPLDWWQRTRGGLPVWGWASIGAVSVLGGAVALRMARKKRLRSNRRRRRRAVSRRRRS